MWAFCYPPGICMQLFKKFFSIKKKSSLVKVINSHEKCDSIEKVKIANEMRMKQIRNYQKEMAAVRRSNANFAKTFPTKAEIESELKKERGIKRKENWGKYVEGLKKCWNPPVEELKASGKIPIRDEVRRAEKIRKGQENLMQSMKPTILMRRKYLNYLSTEIIPTLVTSENLEAKIQEALESSGSMVNLTAEGVVEIEKEVKRKLKEIRVPLEEYELVKSDEVKM